MGNRLRYEKSPYLLKHAENPVDWHPWGEEAFERASRQDKPVFLSIGYSTCHWCNVMEAESFSDREVAEVLNAGFVCVKVDREERPDIDGIYMSACMMLTGSGGWPLSIVMTPEKKPFYAATYIPKTARFGRPGMLELMPRIAELWRARRGEVLKSAGLITESLARASADERGAGLGPGDLDAAYRELAGSFDGEHGGFGIAPKFPVPQNIFFLLRRSGAGGGAEARAIAEKTLESMRMGGIYDHLGSGFHRYSTDPEWRVPHFEKMLYDQAMLAMAYTEASQAAGRSDFRETAREILAYVLRDMRSPEGAFFSAEGADVGGEEGRFYLWSEKEIYDSLGAGDARLFAKAYGIKAGGNFADPVTGVETGLNVIYLPAPLPEAASRAGMSEEELGARLDAARKTLLGLRDKRPRPERDDKVLADWNGLMIAALARGAQVLGEPEMERAACKAADFVLKNLSTGDGRLLHRWRGGSVGIGASAEDYAFFVWGLIELYEAGFDRGRLDSALRLTDVMVEDFWDEAGGGFYFTPRGGEGLIVRRKEVYDGAIPSSNSVAMLNMLRLSRLASRPGLEKKAGALSEAFSERVRKAPSAYCMLMCAVDFALGPSHEVVVAGKRGARDTEEMLAALRSAFLPRKVVHLAPPGEEGPPGRGGGFPMLGGRATAYVCTGYSCREPTAEPSNMLGLLQG